MESLASTKFLKILQKVEILCLGSKFLCGKGGA